MAGVDVTLIMKEPDTRPCPDSALILLLFFSPPFPRLFFLFIFILFLLLFFLLHSIQATANGTNCMFKESIIGNFHSFGSIYKPDWTIGFDCHGKPINHLQVSNRAFHHQASPKQRLCTGQTEHDDDQYRNQGKCFQLLRVAVPPNLLKNK